MWPNGCMHQDGTYWHGGRPQPRKLCVIWGPSPLPKKGAEPPIFGPYVYCCQMVAWINMSLCMEIGLGQDDMVLDGDPAPPPQKGAELPPQFSVHVYCGQTAGWIKMTLGMEVVLVSGHTVLDGDPAPLPKRGPNFRPFLLWSNGWMHQNATWYGGRPQPRGLCVRCGDPAPSPKRAEPCKYDLTVGQQLYACDP